jgi:L-threonylcarbamoyladenylate synthase
VPDASGGPAAGGALEATAHGIPAIVAADDDDAIAVAAAALLAGGIVGLPTETVYGVAVLPRPEPLRVLLAAKQRPQDKGIPLLLDGLDQVVDLVILSDAARRLAERFWPGPLTLALPLRQPELVPRELSGGRGSVAIRIADHPVPRSLARELGPIAVTSANLSGEPEARTANELIQTLGASLAVVIDDGPVRGGVPSSVVAVDVAGQFELLREGALSHAALRAALED